MQNKGGYVVTVLGSIEAERLGFCQSHEHLCVKNDYIREKHPALYIDDPVLTLSELWAYREAEGQALVDAQPIGTGRDAETLRFLAEGSGVHIIASTGFHRMIYYPKDHWIFRWKEDRLEELFSVELMQGMYEGGDTEEPLKHGSIRAGQIKAALEAGPLDAQYGKLFSAVARAHMMTGAPVMVHIEKDADPLMLALYLEKRGVPPEKMVFCHMDRASSDLSVHEAVARRGIYLEYDTIARPKYHTDKREGEIIRHMVGAGYQDRLLASLDVTRHRMVAYGGSPGLDYILKSFLPMLEEEDIPSQVVTQIFHINPACAFGRE